VGKLGGDRTRKREIAPTFYVTSRKKYTFITKPSPGPHRGMESYDAITLLRDVLGLGYTAREIKRSIKDGMLIVDGRVRRDPAFPIGLMDVVEVKGSNTAYRMVPYKGRLLHPFMIDQDEKAVKLVRIDGKRLIKDGKVQLGTSDGRTLLVNDGSKYSVGDSILIRVPSQEIIEVIKLNRDALALVIKGSHLGKQIVIKEVPQGRLTRSSMIITDMDGKDITLPKDYVMAVGSKQPMVKLPLVV